jgi:hypothetical protein
MGGCRRKIEVSTDTRGALKGKQEMSNQNNINVGDHVRVLAGSHTGEIATVGNIKWLTNQFGSYARIHLTYEGGKVADRSMESVEKVNDKPGSAN